MPPDRQPADERDRRDHPGDDVSPEPPGLHSRHGPADVGEQLVVAGGTLGGVLCDVVQQLDGEHLRRSEDDDAGSPDRVQRDELGEQLTRPGRRFGDLDPGKRESQPLSRVGQQQFGVRRVGREPLLEFSAPTVNGPGERQP